MQLSELITKDTLSNLLTSAKNEDLGERGDISSALIIPANTHAKGAYRARKFGVICGTELLHPLVEIFGGNLNITINKKDGVRVNAGEEIAQVEGEYRTLLAYERTSLNLLTHLSGIATLTSRFVETVKANCPKTDICDTRKTHLGLRGLEKYAVFCGGGTPHRYGLYDAVLWKDNHLSGIPLNELENRLKSAIAEGYKLTPKPKFFEVEVDTLEQLEVVLKTPIDIVLLDNMTCEDLKKAVNIRDNVAPSIKLEASGSVTLDSVTQIAKTGVDRISIGALTHSALAHDIGLDLYLT